MMDEVSAQVAMSKRRQSKAVEMLFGLVTGMVADDHLHDREIHFLQAWLGENAEIAGIWPGSVIAERVREALHDGVISDAERAHLLDTLRSMATTDFSASGSVGAEVLRLPLQDEVAVDIRGQSVCHTGVFLYGTRARCEALTAAAGGVAVGSVTRRVSYLVVGTNVAPDWAHTSYGRKIESAVALQQEGHSIAIISERRWLAALEPSAA